MAPDIFLAQPNYVSEKFSAWFGICLKLRTICNRWFVAAALFGWLRELSITDAGTRSVVSMLYTKPKCLLYAQECSDLEKSHLSLT